MKSLEWISFRRRGGPGPQLQYFRTFVSFNIFHGLNPHELQYFRKFRFFEITVACTTDAWARITFLIRNGWPPYFHKTKFKHIETIWLQNLSGIHPFRNQKFQPNIENAQIVQAHSCDQLHVLVQFLYGVTTLRDISWRQDVVKLTLSAYYSSG